MQACPTGFLCGGEIRRVSCLPSSSQRTDAIPTEAWVVPSSTTSVSHSPSPGTAELWTVMKTHSGDQGKYVRVRYGDVCIRKRCILKLIFRLIFSKIHNISGAQNRLRILVGYMLLFKFCFKNIDRLW